MDGKVARRHTGRLSDRVAADLRVRVQHGEWTISEKLPSEYELADHYGVSRATVRTALHALDQQGLTMTNHGVGTFVTAAGQVVSADLQRLESISQTIVRMGRVPSNAFRSIAIRPSTEEEAGALGIPVAADVLSMQREILADGDVVAYSHDAIPLTLLPVDFDVRSVDGSMFVFLESHGVVVRSSITNIHASPGREVGWAPRDDATLYVLLEQVHFDDANRAVASSKTWFIEGRFQFSIVRVR